MRLGPLLMVSNQGESLVPSQDTSTYHFTSSKPLFSQGCCINQIWSPCAQKHIINCKANVELAFDSAIPLLGTQVEELKTGPQRGTCAPMFVAALLPVAQRWKQPTCPLTREWIHKMWHFRTMKYYSAQKRKEIPTHATTWINLEDIVLHEVSQAQKRK